MEETILLQITTDQSGRLLADALSYDHPVTGPIVTSTIETSMRVKPYLLGAGMGLLNFYGTWQNLRIG